MCSLMYNGLAITPQYSPGSYAFEAVPLSLSHQMLTDKGYIASIQDIASYYGVAHEIVGCVRIVIVVVCMWRVCVS